MQNTNELLNYLHYNYDIFKEVRLDSRTFRSMDILPIIKDLKETGKYKIGIKGYSSEDRPIYQMKIGSGPKRVFLWSQMHGDESTGTASLFDLCNFLISPKFHNITEPLLKNLSIYLMPMVNPDGAERFTRNNALNIDINRDIIRLNSPESNILLNSFNEINPRFAFNLHDQSPLYSVGRTPHQAVFSFLAPAYNDKKDINDNRNEGMLLLAEMYALFSNLIPGHIGRYQDDFEPRAFGDYFQSAGASTILIECGGWKEDIDKQFIRRLNSLMLIHALISINFAGYSGYTLDDYFKIPVNEKLFFDVLLRNLIFHLGTKEVILDIGINFNSCLKTDSRHIEQTAIIEEIADLSVFYGIEEYDLTGCEVTLPPPLPNLTQSSELLPNREVTAPGDHPTQEISTELSKKLKNEVFTPGMQANFLIFKNSLPHYSVVNGRLKLVTSI